MTDRVPTRQCAGCNARRPQHELRRLTAVSGVLVADGRKRSPGRGVYLCPREACAQAARRRGALSRRLRTRIENTNVLEPTGPE